MSKIVIYNSNNPKKFAVIKSENGMFSVDTLKLAKGTIGLGPYLIFPLNKPSAVCLPRGPFKSENGKHFFVLDFTNIAFDSRLEDNVRGIFRLMGKEFSK